MHMQLLTADQLGSLRWSTGAIALGRGKTFISWGIPLLTKMSADLMLAGDAGDQFPKLFYATLDNNRPHLIGFYTDASTLVWNGNVHKGTRAIAGFYSALPNSNHSLLSVDCQPLKVDIPGEPRLLVSCAGQVTFGAQTDSSAFAHTFILEREGEIWKIASETFRCNVENT